MEDVSEELQPNYSNFLVHYYRAEVGRETAWRSRLDITTNWAIVISGAMLTFVFGNLDVSHVVLIINYLIVWFFLYIEARRFRYYAVVKDRVRIFEKRILGPLMGLKDDEKTEEWLQGLSYKLTHPKITMSRFEALSWRLRKNYFFILFVVFCMWIYKVGVYPVQARDISMLIENANVAFVPGFLVLLSMTLSLVAAFCLAYYVSRNWKGNDLP
jgi:uncharacterized membrane protein